MNSKVNLSLDTPIIDWMLKLLNLYPKIYIDYLENLHIRMDSSFMGNLIKEFKGQTISFYLFIYKNLF